MISNASVGSHIVKARAGIGFGRGGSFGSSGGSSRFGGGGGVGYLGGVRGRLVSPCSGNSFTFGLFRLRRSRASSELRLESLLQGGRPGGTGGGGIPVVGLFFAFGILLLGVGLRFMGVGLGNISARLISKTNR